MRTFCQKSVSAQGDTGAHTAPYAPKCLHGFPINKIIYLCCRDISLGPFINFFESVLRNFKSIVILFDQQLVQIPFCQKVSVYNAIHVLTMPHMLVNVCLHGLEIFHWALCKFSRVCLGKFQKHRDFILATTCQDSHTLCGLR